MNITISIEKDTCIKCTKCVNVCPEGILVQKKKKEEISIQNLELCIACGHCAAVCADDALHHSSFPNTKLHKIESAKLPTPEEVLMLTKVRRSTRKFTQKPIPKERLDMILESAHRAPTGSNEQHTKFLLIQNPNVLKKVADFSAHVTIGILNAYNDATQRAHVEAMIPSVGDFVPMMEVFKASYINGDDPVLRKAPYLILMYTPKNSITGYMDANLSYQNASLMATSLDIGHFYTGMVLSAVNIKKGKLEELLEIDGVITAGMALGISAIKFDKYMDRKPISLTII